MRPEWRKAEMSGNDMRSVPWPHGDDQNVLADLKALADVIQQDSEPSHIVMSDWVFIEGVVIKSERLGSPEPKWVYSGDEDTLMFLFLESALGTEVLKWDYCVGYGDRTETVKLTRDNSTPCVEETP